MAQLAGMNNDTDATPSDQQDNEGTGDGARPRIATPLDSLSASLRGIYQDALDVPVPDDLLALLQQIDRVYQEALDEPVPERLLEEVRKLA